MRGGRRNERVKKEKNKVENIKVKDGIKGGCEGEEKKRIKG